MSECHSIVTMKLDDDPVMVLTESERHLKAKRKKGTTKSAVTRVSRNVSIEQKRKRCDSDTESMNSCSILNICFASCGIPNVVPSVPVSFELQSTNSEDDAVSTETPEKIEPSPPIETSQLDELCENCYEVENIIDHAMFSDEKLYYFVKWLNWDEEFNSWECEENLEDCPQVLRDYWKEVYCEFDANSHLNKSREEVNELRNSLCVPTREILEGMMKKGKHELECSKEGTLMREVSQLAKVRKDHWSADVVAKLKKKLMLRALHIARIEQSERLKQWENEANATENNKVHIFVENDVDLEEPPTDFTYINDYIPSDGIAIPDDPPIGCECGSSCSGSNENCCGAQSGSKFAYTETKQLAIEIGLPIYECNKRCKCDSNCNNRVVQNGRKIKLCIFRTNNGCGWGVKTLERIKKGEFVCKYVGEIITSEEAERRGKIYDAVGRTYLFDLDYNENEQFPYTVDAVRLGNISHFINHSCDPNLAVSAVYVNCLDPNLPQLAFFAKRYIKAGQELSFDYVSQSSNADPKVLVQTSSSEPRLQMDEEAGSDDSSTKVLCKCGTKKCRRYLF